MFLLMIQDNSIMARYMLSVKLSTKKLNLALVK
jgi:hypothetical protein